MVTVKKNEKRRAGCWYEKYLPFIARCRERQIEWLANKFKKKSLTYQELTPYIKLLLEEDDPDGIQTLRGLLAELSDEILGDLMQAADVYDTPKLLLLMPRVTADHAAIAMSKVVPPYERSPTMVIDRIFQIIHDISHGLLEEGAARLRGSGKAPPHFEESFVRYQEVLKDQEFLSTLYPKARS